MKRYIYNYQTIVRFYGEVTRHFVKLRCEPCENACQRVVQRDFIIHPQFGLREDTDFFGNRFLYGQSLDTHDSMAYISSGIVELEPYAIPDDSPCGLYLYNTPKTTVLSHEMAALRPEGGSVMERAKALCHAVSEAMTYEPFSTDTGTTADEALARGRGVCQDYAHIMLALCRYNGIAARYVSGFISGEGATHAWVEVHDGEAWRGLDPTHDRVIEYGYIKIAHGRDSDDASVNRGTFTGGNGQQTETRVIVYEL